jgi:protein transport protein HofC
MEAGLPWWDSLWRRRLISAADRSLLESAERLGNLPWALQAVAEWHHWRLTYRMHWWLHLLAPPLVILVGMVVGFVVVALFMPLIKIIETLT